MHIDLDTNMKSIGKRFPYYAKYTVSNKLITSYCHIDDNGIGWIN